MKRTTYHTAQPAAPPAIHPVAHPAPSALTERIRAACLSGLGVFLLLLILLPGCYAMLVERPRLKTAGGLALAAVVLGLGLTCYLLVTWSIQTASRDWRVDHAERLRRWQIEDEDRILAREQAEQAAEAAPGSVDLTWMHRLALAILERHYTGLKTTRAECTKAGLCSQPEWNLINRVFKSAGFKQGNSFRPPAGELAEAWALWMRQVSIEDDVILCRRQPDGTTGIDRITVSPNELES